MDLDDPTPQDRAAFDEIRREESATIRDMESQLATFSASTEALPRLRALHARLTQTEIPQLIDGLRAAGETVALRDTVTELVQSAVLADSWPERRRAWLRFEVTWTDDVQKLIDAGLLWLDEQPQPPTLDPAVTAKRATQARYRARHRTPAAV